MQTPSEAQQKFSRTHLTCPLARLQPWLRSRQFRIPFSRIGGPVIEAVPTGIRYAGGQLLVSLFKGVPFPVGASQIQRVDPISGAQAPFILGRKTAIDVLPLQDGDDTDYLVLQHASLSR